MNPTVAVIAPAGGSFLLAGSTVNLAASAAATSPATIASVAFYANGALLSTINTAPFQYAWSQPTGGQYSITAVATDSNGLQTTSNAISVTLIQLRTDFPEFSSSTSYPDAVVNFWLGVAGNMLIASRWGSMLSVGIELYAAHNLVLEAQAALTTAVGGIPGVSKGPVSAEGVDKGSVSYDSVTASESGAGNWNLTTYGSRFIRMAKMFGAGGLQIGIGYNPNPFSGGAWTGPDCDPGFTNFGN